MALNPFHGFRKHQKTLLAPLTIFTMFSFVLTGFRGGLGSGGGSGGQRREGPKPIAHLYGQPLYADVELRETRVHRELANLLMVRLLQRAHGVAISNIMLERLEEVVQQPDAPSFYWPLSDLPRPFIDMRKPLEGERVSIYGTFPGMNEMAADLSCGPWTPEQVEKVVNTFQFINDEPTEVLRLRDEALMLSRLVERHDSAKKMLIGAGRPKVFDTCSSLRGGAAPSGRSGAWDDSPPGETPRSRPCSRSCPVRTPCSAHPPGRRPRCSPREPSSPDASSCAASSPAAAWASSTRPRTACSAPGSR